MVRRNFDKEAKKEQILRRTIQVFATTGVAGTKMDDLASKISIAKGTIYEYFSSRDELFAEAFRYMLCCFDQEIENRMRKIDDPRDQLRAFLLAMSETLTDTFSDYTGIILDFWAAGAHNDSEDQSIRREVRAAYVMYRKRIARILRQGINEGHFRKVNVAAVSSIFLAVHDGLLLQWLTDKKRVNVKQGLAAFVDAILMYIQDDH